MAEMGTDSEARVRKLRVRLLGEASGLDAGGYEHNWAGMKDLFLETGLCMPLHS